MNPGPRRLFAAWLLVSLLSTTAGASEIAELEGVLTTGHFEIRFDPSLTGAAADLAERADAIRAAVLADLGSDRPEHTRVLLNRDAAQMARTAPAGLQPPAWAAGMALADKNLILLRLIGPDGQVAELDELFRHEWAHLALHAATDNRPLPRWFQEGFAIHQSGESPLLRFSTLAQGTLSDRLLSLEALTERFPTEPAQVQLAYAQSMDFVGYLLGCCGPEKFHRLVTLLGAGWPFIEALEEAYDLALRALEDRWRTDLKRRFTWLPIWTGTTVLWLVAAVALALAWARRRKERRAGVERLRVSAEDDVPPPPLDDHSP